MVATTAQSQLVVPTQTVARSSDLDKLLDAFQIDQTVRQVLALFPGESAKELLVRLLSSATIEQLALPDTGCVDVAKLDTGTLETFARKIGWGKDTFLRYVATLCAVGLIRHYRYHDSSGQRNRTELHFPLVPYRASNEAIRELDKLIYNGRRKLQQLASGVRNRYCLAYSFSAPALPTPSGMGECEAGEPYATLLKIQTCLQKKRLSRVERQLLQRDIADVLVHMGRPERITESVIGEGARGKEKRVFLLHTQEGDLKSALSQGQGNDFVSDHIGGVRSPEEEESIGLEEGSYTRKTCASRKQGHQQEEGDTSEGASDEQERVTETPWVGSEEDLFAEVVSYMIALDGEEYTDKEYLEDYLKTHPGKRHFNGYKNKIKRSPRLARISAINALMQLHFPEGIKKNEKLQRPGGRFHKSFDLYADEVRPMEILAEISNWAASPYSIEEIAKVLPQERSRQEYNWMSGIPPRRPLAACVAKYGHLGYSEEDSQSPRKNDDTETSQKEEENGENDEAQEIPADLLQAWQQTDYSEKVIDVIMTETRRWQEAHGLPFAVPYPDEVIADSSELQDFWVEGGAHGLVQRGWLFVSLDGDLYSCKSYQQRRLDLMKYTLDTERASFALSPEVEYEVLTCLQWTRPYPYSAGELGQVLACRHGLRQQFEKLIATVDPEGFEVTVLCVPTKRSPLIEVRLKHDPSQATLLCDNNQVADFIRWYLEGTADQQRIDDEGEEGDVAAEENKW